jgi:hypothetical protein
MQLGFHPVALVGRRSSIGKRKHKRRKNKQNNKKHRIHKIENKNKKQETNIKRMLKNVIQVIRK